MKLRVDEEEDFFFVSIDSEIPLLHTCRMSRIAILAQFNNFMDENKDYDYAAHWEVDCKA